MTISYATYPKFKAWAPDGRPAAGYLLYTKLHGTLIHKRTFSDSGLTTENPEEVVLDDEGEADLYLENGTYDFILKTPAGADYRTFGPIEGSPVALNNALMLDTVADLGLYRETDGTRAFVSGYYTAGDGKACPEFYYDSTSEAVPNFGTVFYGRDELVEGRWLAVTRGKMLRPENFGAYADGETDDSPYIAKLFDVAEEVGGILYPGSEQEGQYRLPIFDFSNAKFLITERIIVNQRHNFKGATFICSGDGDGFKVATNAIPAGVLNNDEVDCCFLVIDGGYLSDCTIRADTTLDVTGNESIWLVCAQEIYGKKPLSNLVLNGSSTGKNLGMLTARWCTTSTIADVGGTYFAKGFRAYSSNQMTYQSLFAQHIRSGATNYPFDFDTVGRFTVQGCWHEQGGLLTTVYIFRNSAFGKVHAMQIGEPSGASYDTGLKVQSCEDMVFTGFEISGGVSFSTAKTTVTASSRYSFDRTYSVTPDTYQYQASGQLLNMDLSDTGERFFIGYIPNGGRLVLNCVSRSGAITTPSFNIYKVVAGVETLLGNIAYLSFTNIGERKSKEFDIVSTQLHYITPSTGTGDVDLDWEFKLYDV